MKKGIVLVSISILAVGMLAGCSGQKTESEETTVVEKITTAQITEANQVTEANQITQNNDQNIISEEEAKSIALNDAGVKADDVTGIRVKLETDNGRWEYEVDFYVGNQEYDYTIAAADGKVLEKDSEIDYDFNLQNNNSNDTISRKEAIDIVLARVNGAKESDVRIHLDIDDGRQIYEGSVVYNEMEYDFEVDAKSGSILEWEAESIYD